MTRMAGVPTKDAGLLMRLTFFFVRRGMAKLTGREPERILEAVQVTAHAPEVLRSHGKLEQATAKMDRVDRRTKGLALAKAAVLTQCEYCLDLGSQILRRGDHLTDEEMLALPSYRTSPLFTAVEKLVMDYAVGMTRTPPQVPDELFAELQEHFDSAQLVELTHMIALENFRGRFNRGLGIEAAGFSEGMVCPVPEALPPSAPVSDEL